MTKTRYEKTFRGENAASSLISFSTKKASLISITPEMFADIEAGRLSTADKAALLSLNFLCESAEAERAEMLGFIDEMNNLSRTFAAKIVMNLECNLACIYCFEGRRKGRHFMTRETADLFISFVKRWINDLDVRTGDEKIVITFYGGEPLLSADLILYISEKIKNVSKDNGIRYIAYVVTNGTLLIPKLVDSLSAAGLEGAVVTLDGPRRIHDSLRPFKTGNGSFDLIVKNLLDVCEMIPIGIGGNYMSDNYREFPHLLDFMLENGLTPDRLESVGFNPVTAESPGYGPVNFNEGCLCINEPWLFEATVFLREEILRRGFKNPSGLVPAVCSLDMHDNYLVNHDGSIYKCPGLIGREEFIVGDLKTGIRHRRQPHGIDNWKNEECLECCYLPLCFGGCRYEKLVRDGNMDGVDCKRPYFDAVLESLVKQDIKYQCQAVM